MVKANVLHQFRSFPSTRPLPVGDLKSWRAFLPQVPLEPGDRSSDSDLGHDHCWWTRPICSVTSLFLAKPWHLHPSHLSWHPLGLQPPLNYFSKAFFRADTCSSFPYPIRRCERLQDILKLESSPGYTLQLRPRSSPLEPPHLSKSLLSHPPDYSFHGSWPVGWWARGSLLRKTPFVAASNVVPSDSKKHLPLLVLKWFLISSTCGQKLAWQIVFCLPSQLIRAVVQTILTLREQCLETFFIVTICWRAVATASSE